MQFDDAVTDLPRASQVGGARPRPQLLRRDWADLSGPWGFAFDDEDAGRAALWQEQAELGVAERWIEVPFPPESTRSGIADTGFHRVVWYRRELTAQDLSAAGFASRRGGLLLHFGAVDYRAEVWLDGRLIGRHEGGHTPFSFEIGDAVRTGDRFSLVVRVEDDPLDTGQPRGKQDWHADPHVIWYHRTTGIWQPVWLEAVPEVAVASLHWTADLPAATVRVEVGLTRPPLPGTTCTIVLEHDGRRLGALVVPVGRDRFSAVVSLPDQENGQGYEDLLWSPDHPRLVDATVVLAGPAGDPDAVSSYLGLRSTAVAGGRFLLNDRDVLIRSVLEQGYWPSSHLAAPSGAAIEAEVRLIKDLGFNAARLHQKFEDPRFLYWADRLGLMVWSETPGAYDFSPTAVSRMTREWLEVLDRDRSHPSIVTWVPLNESWGVQHIAASPAMQSYARALTSLTRAIDPTRPVISNDGWEHVDSDILSIHDYEDRPEVMRRRYGAPDARARLLAGIGPAGRRLVVGDGQAEDAPMMLTEFGGIRYTPDGAADDAWGYSAAVSADDFRTRLTGLLDAVRGSELLAGFCYTQLTDTLQEANGLLTEDREPKLPVAVIRGIITGIPAARAGADAAPR
ncbi:glycoside hydrolase family 2 protein [uncultured Amnibacterium sp.]|uniref:glycoside hydrolase family 2 protein n=1 Tax=uncultured Amnibacterium sp. TaxID=1631851 RepID=UPI0035CB77D8